jgi:hypothetical protein
LQITCCRARAGFNPAFNGKTETNQMKCPIFPLTKKIILDYEQVSILGMIPISSIPEPQYAQNAFRKVQVKPPAQYVLQNPGITYP